jgi:HD-GYP domain-containing protein (c-di-GMP phosphodiesterase class II)
MPESAKSVPQENPNFTPKLYGIAALVTVLVLSGLWLVSRYTQSDFQRDQAIWQEKLSLIAESRASEVNKWVAEHFNELRLLADNPSLRVYMTEIQMQEAATPAQAPAEPAAQSYLRSLLLFSAERTGFINRSNMSSIPANVMPETVNGVAIFNNKNEAVVSTILNNEARTIMAAQVKKIAAGQEGFIDMFKASDNKPYMGFVVPIYSIQGDRNAASQIGHVVGLIAADDAFFALLKHPGVTEKTLETILVRKAGGRLQYLSPLQDGSTPLAKDNAMDANKFSEVNMANNVGGFAMQQKDYRDKPILGTSRNINGTPWTMIVKIDRPEAYASGNDRRVSMMTFFLLMIAFIIMVIIAIWWYAHSKRAIFLSRYFRKLAAQSQSQEMLLKLVTDYQPESIMIVDTSNTIHFANLQAAVDANLTPGTLTGKSIKDVVGKDRAVQIGGQCLQALEDNAVGYDMYRIHADDKERVVRSAFVPLKYIPVPSLSKKVPGVLVVDQDVTEVVHERERRTKTSQQLVNMLVSLVDKRDPFSANHSQLVSKVAYEVAISVALDQSMVETTETAARMMNIGKIVVPTELLTKTSGLTEEEKAIVRDSMNVPSDMLHGISFDGPVEETLRQWQERWDGNGPLGLKHESILVSARIIAVANAFVGMISPRAWRDAIPVDQANKFLLEDSDKAFDRRIVIALINYVENHSGREWLTKMMIDTSGFKKVAR